MHQPRNQRLFWVTKLIITEQSVVLYKCYHTWSNHYFLDKCTIIRTAIQVVAQLLLMLLGHCFSYILEALHTMSQIFEIVMLPFKSHAPCSHQRSEPVHLEKRMEPSFKIQKKRLHLHPTSILWSVLPMQDLAWSLNTILLYSNERRGGHFNFNLR